MDRLSPLTVTCACCSHPNKDRRHFLKCALYGVTLVSPVRVLAQSTTLPTLDQLVTVPTHRGDSLGVRPSSQLPMLDDRLTASTSQSNLPSPSAGRSLADSSLSQIAALSNALRSNAQAIARLTGALGHLRAELDALMKQKNDALWELENGLYCSQCNRSKSEIERESGENFEAHVQRVAGRILRAPQTVIDAKAASFDQRIKEKRAELDTAGKALAAARQESDGLWSAVQAATDVWQLGIDFEQKAIGMQADHYDKLSYSAADEIRKKIADIDHNIARSAGDLTTLNALLQGRERWELRLTELHERSALRMQIYFEDSRRAHDGADRERIHMSKMIMDAFPDRDYLRSVLGGETLVLTWNRYSFSMSADDAFLRLKLGLNSGVRIGAWRTDGGDLVTGAQLEILGDYRLRVGYQTRYVFGAVEWAPSADFTIAPRVRGDALPSLRPVPPPMPLPRIP